jgi:hypothetical protein
LEALDAGKDPNERDSEIGDHALLHWAAGVTDEENWDEVGAHRFTMVPRSRRRKIVELLVKRGAHT